MNALQCRRAARAQTSSGHYRMAAFTGLAVAALVCGPAVGQDDPDDIGEWNDPPNTGPFWGVDEDLIVRHSVHLPDGSILVWQIPSRASLWDPRLDELTEMGTSFTINCTGHAGLADGRIVFAGGSGATTETKIYSLEGCPACPWLPAGDMNYARFYPTLTTLPNGRVLVTGGREPNGMGGDPVLTPEIFDPEADPPEDSWTDLDVETTGTKTYPHMFVVPDEDPDIHKVFFSSSFTPNDSDTDTYILDISDPDDPSWTEEGVDPLFHTSQGSAVMYEPGKVLKCGGQEFPAPGDVLAETATIDLTESMPAWQSELPMMIERQQHNLVLLPDGKILAIGGDDGVGDVNEAEWFDPNEPLPTWEVLAEMEYPRGLHSTAVLLADGRVLSVGGINATAEIFSPPYLFKNGDEDADRPKVGYAPTDVAYGTSFSVVLASGSPVSRDDIAKVTFLRLASVTHGFDMNQRYLSLPVQTDPVRSNGLMVEAPENGTFAPPGYYMLFLISDDDAPSHAKYVRLYEATTP